MLKTMKTILVAFTLVFFAQSCESELDLQPEDNRLTAEAAFEDPAAYKQFLAKLYGGLSVTGQDTTGNPDIVSDDEGASGYLRAYWKVQELPTDEAVIAWNDGAIRNLNYQTWTAGNEFIRSIYNRIFYEVALTNEFLRQTTDAKLNARDVDAELRAEIQIYRAEARFLRAMSYWHAIDLFANVPFVTEDDPVGVFLPPQIQRADLFDWVEAELLDIEDDMIAATSNEYGRADRAAVWMVLAKLYMNAEVYIGTNRNDDAITYVNNVISAGYSIPDAPYLNSFLADNGENGAQDEFIFAIPFDGLTTQSYGGTTFLVHAPVGGSMDPAEFGINGGWFGLRTTPTFVELFPDEENSADGRALFFTDGQQKEIDEIGTFTNGFAISKYRNVTTSGAQGADSTGEFVDIDFPMFRLADAYLMYAELALRGASGADLGTSTTYVNMLRERAYGDTTGNITQADLTLDFILDERGRELYWEGHRRTDLIRFGQYSTQGVWAWKGNVPQGTTTESFRDLMPIPANDLGVNTNLTQNEGY